MIFDGKYKEVQCPTCKVGLLRVEEIKDSEKLMIKCENYYCEEFKHRLVEKEFLHKR